MRRLVLICMMLLLPVQWTWAAAAVYCEHETGAAAQHLGHHEHKHQGATGEVSKDGKTQSPPSADNDCGICHLGVQWLLADLTLALPSSTHSPRLDVLADFSSHIPSAPERPDRRLA
ncbi:MAG: cobalt-zinc-cadmium resistance protein [Vitreoscilla sp.]|nr:cobalt-zinc-cadmium resistance protein [Vitreoscilla sp.]